MVLYENDPSGPHFLTLFPVGKPLRPPRCRAMNVHRQEATAPAQDAEHLADGPSLQVEGEVMEEGEGL